MTLRPIPAQSTSAVAVDVELVIAVDISYSMDPEEQALQREGYINAIISPEFLSALREGMQARIAVAYFEWAGANEQRVVVPWSLIEGPESADAFAEAIRRAPYRRAMRTSVSGAILFGAQLFETSGYRGVRRVIDVSGDGTNNMGMPVTAARDAVLAKGITINGLPIMLKRPNASMLDIDNLDIYYEDCVIGGSGSFVVPIHERNQFKNATRTKLVMEVAGVIPPARAIPAASDAPRVNCLIGERQWQQRWGPGVDFR
ncbi:MAG: DUF1194 domain-containing protein [Pseudorhodoplanes sp.]